MERDSAGSFSAGCCKSDVSHLSLHSFMSSMPSPQTGQPTRRTAKRPTRRRVGTANPEFAAMLSTFAVEPPIALPTHLPTTTAADSPAPYVPVRTPRQLTRFSTDFRPWIFYRQFFRTQKATVLVDLAWESLSVAVPDDQISFFGSFACLFKSSPAV